MFAGSNRVIAGPHVEFTKADKLAHFVDKRTYLTPPAQSYNKSINLRNEIPLQGTKEELLRLNTCNKYYV